MFYRALKFVAPTLLFVASLSSGRAGTILFTQPPTPATESYTTWESEDGPTGILARTYDSFSLVTATTVGSVLWVGDYIDEASGASNPAAADATAFEISFWSDAGGQPDKPLATSTIPLSDVHQTSLGKTTFELPSGKTITIPVFGYNAKLTAPFRVEARQTYWISILAITPSDQPLWGWQSGTGGNGNCVQDFDGSRYTRQLDRSFALEAENPAKITVDATVPITHLTDELPGVFTVKSSEAAAVATVVHYSLKGTAVNGEDYDRLTGTVKIKAHATSATVSVFPKGTLEGSTKKTVKLVLDPGAAYVVGAKDKALVTIDK